MPRKICVLAHNNLKVLISGLFNKKKHFKDNIKKGKSKKEQ